MPYYMFPLGTYMKPLMDFQSSGPRVALCASRMRADEWLLPSMS